MILNLKKFYYSLNRYNMHFGVMKQIINFFTPFLKFFQISQIRLDDVSDVNFKQCIIKTPQFL